MAYKVKKPKKNRVVKYTTYLGEKLEGKVIALLSTQFVIELKCGLKYYVPFNHAWEYKNKK